MKDILSMNKKANSSPLRKSAKGSGSKSSIKQNDSVKKLDWDNVLENLNESEDESPPFELRSRTEKIDKDSKLFNPNLPVVHSPRGFAVVESVEEKVKPRRE